MKYKFDEQFIKKHSKDIITISDVLVLPQIGSILNQGVHSPLWNNQCEKWALWGRHSYYEIPGESDYDYVLRLVGGLIDVHPELVGLLKITDNSGELVNYVPEDLFKFDEDFIKNNLENWILLEDYLPFDISNYESLDFPEEGWTAQDDRESYLGDKFKIYKKMGDLIKEKCIYYENRVKAFNSVVIEWLDCHPEFEGIISKESWGNYQQMKNNTEYIEFIDLLDFVKVPSEKDIDSKNMDGNSGKWIHKDDSSIRLPDFKKIDKIYDEYGATLLACYLSYLV